LKEETELKVSRQDIDLMAPVGSFETLHAAIQGGADSVYFGIDRLNMRARSVYNFTPADLQKIVRYCKSFNKNTYLTLNVVVYDNEMSRIKEILDRAKEKGIDAVIASDQAVIQYCRTIGMEVHLSTQLNISNLETLAFYSAYADVAVLARELDLKQVAAMADQIKRQQIKGPSGKVIKLEMFIHGALCMSLSGKCYLSLHHYNQSANRGACLQDCRRAYTVREKETGLELDVENEYIMSPKDLCTIHFLDKILAAGVRVLKIEGRARSPEYVKTVTSCYNEAINSIVEGSYSAERKEAWKERLNSVFNRGFWDGYYLGQKMGEWSDVHGSKASKRKVYAARNLNYFHKLGVGEFLCEADTVRVGDEILIIGPNTGVIEMEIREIHNDAGPVNEVVPGERFAIKLTKKVRRADKLYKVVKEPAS
jgi:U32 family peptidase